MQIHSRQTGITFISLLLLLIMLGFFALLALRLGPLYLENYTIRSALQGLKQDPELAQKGPEAIRSALEKRLYINEIRRFDTAEEKQDIQVRREGEQFKVSVDYEVREHIVANVDAVVSFSNSVGLSAR